MPEFYQRNKTLINKLLWITAVIAGIYLLIHSLFIYIAPFAIGFVISLILQPLAVTLSRKLKIGKGLSALLSLLFLILVVGVLVNGLAVKIINEARNFIESIPLYLDDLTMSFDLWAERYHDLLSFIPDEMETAAQNSIDSLVSSITGLLGAGVRTGTISLVSFLPGMLLGIVLCVVSAFFFIKDKNIIHNFLGGLFPKWFSDKLRILKVGLLQALNGYFKAQFILMCIASTICITGLLIIRYPYALFLGFIVAILDFLPVFGAGTVLLPWTAICLIGGDYPRAVGLLIIYAVIFVVRQLLEPRIVGEQLGVHPLFTLMSIYIGLRVFGIPGVILGPIVVMLVKVIMESNEI